jgi:hypothetical protein
MAADIDVGNGLCDRRHVTGDTSAAFAVGRVLGMKLDRTTWTRLHHAVVALETDGIPRETQVGFVVGAMRVVARITAHTLHVHLALHKVVTLHPILVRGTIWPMRKCFLAQPMLFEAPEVA